MRHLTYILRNQMGAGMKHFIRLTGFLMGAFLCPAHAAKKFPDSLFEVKLGASYKIPANETEVGELPIKKFLGMQKFLGSGIHFYFKPLKEYEAFKYVEKKAKSTDKYFGTSFRLYLLPIIPKTAKSQKDIENVSLRWEVEIIDWTDSAEKKEDAYFWAKDLCESVKIDLERAPKITDIFKDEFSFYSYSCVFSEGQKELKIENVGNLKVFSLSYKNSEFEKRNNSVELLLRKLQMNEIRPY